MHKFLMRSAVCGLLAIAACSALAAGPNKVLGTWRPLSATVDPQGANTSAYGPQPAGQLIFTENMRYSVVLHDPRIAKFASNARGKGTPEENQAAMAGSIALYGIYSVDGKGEFSGNTVEGSTFPNWIGDKRSRDVLSMTVEGDRVTETFQRPAGPKVVIVWERIR